MNDEILRQILDELRKLRLLAYGVAGALVVVAFLK